MLAKIQNYTNDEWNTLYTIITDPLTVTDSEGQALNTEELEVWLDEQRPLPHKGARVTARNDIELWLRLNAAARFTAIRFIIE